MMKNEIFHKEYYVQNVLKNTYREPKRYAAVPNTSSRKQRADAGAMTKKSEDNIIIIITTTLECYPTTLKNILSFWKDTVTAMMCVLCVGYDSVNRMNQKHDKI